MDLNRRHEARRLEGSSVCVALADGSRLDDVQLVSARGNLSIWLFDCGEDVFVALSEVVDIWPALRPAA